MFVLTMIQYVVSNLGILFTDFAGLQTFPANEWDIDLSCLDVQGELWSSHLQNKLYPFVTRKTMLSNHLSHIYGILKP